MDLRFGSLQPTNCCFESLKGKRVFLRPVNKLYYLAYKV